MLDFSLKLIFENPLLNAQVIDIITLNQINQTLAHIGSGIVVVVDDQLDVWIGIPRRFNYSVLSTG